MFSDIFEISTFGTLNDDINYCFLFNNAIARWKHVIKRKKSTILLQNTLTFRIFVAETMKVRM